MKRNTLALVAMMGMLGIGLGLNPPEHEEEPPPPTPRPPPPPPPPSPPPEWADQPEPVAVAVERSQPSQRAAMNWRDTRPVVNISRECARRMRQEARRRAKEPRE